MSSRSIDIYKKKSRINVDCYLIDLIVRLTLFGICLRSDKKNM